VQIADIILNRPFKVKMKSSFNNYATKEVLTQLEAGVPSSMIVHDLSLSTLKPLCVEWMLDAHDHLKTLAPVVLEAYSKTGFLKAWDDEFQVGSSQFMYAMPHLFNIKCLSCRYDPA
jgi:hypothetical protein